jgi:hypothetical protein
MARWLSSRSASTTLATGSAAWFLGCLGPMAVQVARSHLLISPPESISLAPLMTDVARCRASNVTQIERLVFTPEGLGNLGLCRELRSSFRVVHSSDSFPLHASPPVSFQRLDISSCLGGDLHFTAESDIRAIRAKIRGCITSLMGRDMQ